ncbi:hypothetical protein F7725_007844 [Dissostichus mawsoni]|uniref:PH domain-containing protein n=1 Tax=Dissostichus mawsoni TaxID=36200 RepID=A0A7J5Y6K4_DISMA|nr:hypothetical protein F7725_007844 [Dissostichus mawsoni]
MMRFLSGASCLLSFLTLGFFSHSSLPPNLHFPGVTTTNYYSSTKPAFVVLHYIITPLTLPTTLLVSDYKSHLCLKKTQFVQGPDWHSSSDFLNRYNQPQIRSWSFSQAAAFPISVPPSMAADDYNPVSVPSFFKLYPALSLNYFCFFYFMMEKLNIYRNKGFIRLLSWFLCSLVSLGVSLRHKSKRKIRGGNGTMSRRRISVKELGQPDHQGWLYRKKESKGFLGIKWKKYWFVLKKTALYWYNNQLAEKAEGYIDLANFMIDRAIECKKKHAFKACHPQVMMFYFAAESHEDMNLMSQQNKTRQLQSVTVKPVTTKKLKAQRFPLHRYTSSPYSSAVPSEATGSLSSPVSTMTSQSSTSSLAKHRQSWLDLVSQAPPPTGETAVVCSVQVHSPRLPQGEVEEEEDPQVSESSSHQDSLEVGSHEESPAAEGNATGVVSGAESEGDRWNSSDEMEKLYIHLKEASLSPIGDRKPSRKGSLGPPLTLNSTLKSKEADLNAIEQVLTEPGLTSEKFREWKEANGPLLQEICVKHDQQVEAEATKAAVSVIAVPVVETSL